MDVHNGALRARGANLSRWLETDESLEGGLGNETPAAQANDGELTPGDELIGEGARDAQQCSCLGTELPGLSWRGA